MSGSRRNILRPLGHVVAVLAAIFVLLVLLSLLFMPKDNTEEAGMIDPPAHGVLAEPANTIDVLFLGNSETYSSISPMEMWKREGITSYVCATAAQKLTYTYSLLRQATKEQTPRVVVIEADSIYDSVGASDIAKRMVQDVLPVFEYHDRWKGLTLRDLDPHVEYTWIDDCKGYHIYTWSTHADPETVAEHMAPADYAEEIGTLSKWCLGKIVEYCRSIGAEPVIVNVPNMNNWSMARHNAIAAWAAENDVDYIDFNVEPTKVDIDWTVETRDEGNHVNHFGAVKTSVALGTYLAETYDLPNHRGDADYAAWDDSLAIYDAKVDEALNGRWAQENPIWDWE